MVQLTPLPPRHLLLQQNLERFILLVLAYPACPGKRILNKRSIVVVVTSQYSVIFHADKSDTFAQFPIQQDGSMVILLLFLGLGRCALEHTAGGHQVLDVLS